MHAVFISGFAKITLPEPFRLSFQPGQRYNVFGYQGFSSMTWELGLAIHLY